MSYKPHCCGTISHDTPETRTIAPSQVRGRNKFEPYKHEFMPDPVQVWADAMASIDLSRPARPGNEIWGRFVPEPSLILGPQTVEKRRRFMLSWLRIRAAWIYLLDTNTARVTSRSSQWWRDILVGPEAMNTQNSTLGSRRWASIKDQFGHLFREEEWNERGGYVDWHEHVFDGQIKQKYVPTILWELTELAFCQELLGLDRVLVPRRNDPGYEVKCDELLARVFPDKNVHGPAQLPSGPEGLADPMIVRCTSCLEGLRRVILRWPLPGRTPPSKEITIATPITEFLNVEQELASIYVNTFFAYAGRAPSIPHVCPIQYVPDECDVEVDDDSD